MPALGLASEIAGYGINGDILVSCMRHCVWQWVVLGKASNRGQGGDGIENIFSLIAAYCIDGFLDSLYETAILISQALSGLSLTLAKGGL
ncbi:hypothetical protein ACHAPT_001213 [Fusarium lateritium]